MKIVDVQGSTIGNYTLNLENNSLQKVVIHSGWETYNNSRLLDTEEETILLLEEKAFSYYRFTIHLDTKSVFTWSQYKKLLLEKQSEVQSELGVDAKYVNCVVKNLRCNNQAVEYIIGSSGSIQFDVCYYVLDETYRDILRYPRLKYYPRWYFLLSHPLLFDREQSLLLHIDGAKTTLITLHKGWYSSISSLNGGDDLLWEAYEACGLDPLKTTEHRFDLQSLGYKLLGDAHTEYLGILMGWLASETSTGIDMFLLSRLINQGYFMHRMNEAFLENFSARLIPYKGGKQEKSSKIQYTRQPDDLPVRLFLESIV